MCFFILILLVDQFFLVNVEAHHENSIKKRIIHLNSHEATFIRILLASKAFQQSDMNRQHMKKQKTNLKTHRILQDVTFDTFYLIG